MTKVSTRHLNEIVRERNQYSRDAQDAWQDFITSKNRMDTELSKVTKRNNFLVDELESWKQQVGPSNMLSTCGRWRNLLTNRPQFLKFQAFAEQLTKETQDLKFKIDHHKRENRRLTTLVEQQKDDAARLALRLSGTEKQRNDALEALVLQQEIAEELERERKRNKKELSGLKHANASLMRQKEEAQRVVVHLRSLIDGQAHHMEYIVRSLNRVPELSDSVDEDDRAGSPAIREYDRVSTPARASSVDRFRRTGSRAHSRASTNDGRPLDGEDVNPDMERRLFGSPLQYRPYSQLSLADVADRHLQDKTDAIAEIIRNISEQCAAAVEGLHLARGTDDDRLAHLDDVDELDEDGDGKGPTSSEDNDGDVGVVAEDEAEAAATASAAAAAMPDRSAPASEMGEHETDHRHLSPHGGISPYPPTPDLVHRSSTSMSMNSQSTTPERQSQQYVEVPTKIVEDDDEAEAAATESNLDSAPPTSALVDGVAGTSEEHGPTTTGKHPSASLIRRPAGARISALGQA